MAYIGNTVENQGFTPAIDYFNGNGVTVTFTLSRPIASVAQVIVAIDNVIQNPSSSFTIAGNAITFSSAPLSGTNNIWVEYTSLITTYQGISQDPTVIGDIRATGGYLAEGDFGNSFVAGAILDYVTGLGRITVGSAEGIALYNGGTSGRVALASWNASGTLTNTGGAVIQGLTVGKGGGAVATATAFGYQALNTTPATNTTAVGYQALFNGGGGSETAVGYQALYSETSAGGGNTAVGRQAAYSINGGGGNSAFGSTSLFSTTTGNNNAAYGQDALRTNTTGSSNVACGNDALYSNTTASNNTAVGYQALYSGTTAQRSVAVGKTAGYAITTGSYNTFLGEEAGLAATTSSGNTFIGQGSGQLITTGGSNTVLGRYGGNQGGLDIRTASNYIVLSDGDGNPELIMGGGYNALTNQQIITSNTKGGTVNILSRAQVFPTDNTITSAILLVTAVASEGTAGGYTRSDVIFISKRFGNQISATNIGSSDGISATNWTYGYDGSNFRVTQNWSAGGSSLGTRWSILVVSGANVG
jgi:hypothetical protein